jgi:hypothetical protein
MKDHGYIRLVTLLALGWAGVAASSYGAVASRSPENQVFQFMTTASATGGDGRERRATAYLWIAPDSRRVRGVLVAGRNVPEHWLVGHPAIRQACAESGLAILWCCPSFFDYTIKDGKYHGDFVQRLLNALAAQSGYDELATVPWLPIGESMHLQMVMQIVTAWPERCIAGVQIKNAFLNPSDTGVPMLLAVGTCDEWDQEKKDLLNQWKTITLQEGLRRQRAATPAWPSSLLVEGGSGHFECTEPMAIFIAQYIRAAARARLPTDGSPTLRRVDLDSGCVAGLPLPGAKPVAPTRYKDCPPENRNLPWYFTAGLAQAACDTARINWNAETQVPVFADASGKALPFGYRGIFSPLPFTTEADGVTFQLHTTFLDKIPDGWVHAGTLLGHAPGEPVVEWICGQVAPLGGNRFRIALDRTWGNSPTFVRVWHPGNDLYRPAVQPGELKLMPNRKGKPQTVAFAPIPDQRAGAKEIQLHVTSDAGLPVQFFVRCGPAEIHGDRLVFTPIPPRSRLPLTVTVAAWQWGRTQEPQVQAAEIVERRFSRREFHPD